VAACSGGAVPASPTDLVAHEAVVESSGTVEASAGQSDCHAVKFNVSGDPGGSGFVVLGEVSGDLAGTVTMTFDPDSVKFAGVTIKVGGVAQWDVTDGVVPGLVEFETSFDNKNLATDRPGSPAWVFENIGTHRALTGVQKANLHYSGISDFAEPRAFSHDYQGVICP